MDTTAIEVKTHDYTQRCWGHDFTIMSTEDGGQRLRMMGWGHGLKSGEYILLPNGTDEHGVAQSTRYLIDTVRYMSNPADMWSVEATFAPRKRWTT